MSSCIYYNQRNQAFPAHQSSLEDDTDAHRYTTHNSFATSPSINAQSVSLSLQPVETRATRNEVTNPSVLIRELDAIVYSIYVSGQNRSIPRSRAAPVRPISQTIPRPILARSTGRSTLVGAQFGRPSLTVAPVTRTPIPAPAPHPFANGKGKTCTTDGNST